MDQNKDVTDAGQAWDTPETPVEETSTDDDPEVKALRDLTKAQTKSVADVAKEVVEGKWGVGQTRRQALADAGYDPLEVQEEVKKLLNP